MKKYCIFFLFLLPFTTRVSAQENLTEIIVGFRVGSGILDPAYDNNAVKLSNIVSLLQSVQNDSSLILTNVSFCGYTSLEGSERRNRQLSRERLSALEEFVRNKVELPEKIISREEQYIPWDELKRMVNASDIPYKDEVATILDERSAMTRSENGMMIDARIDKLMKLHEGKAWKYMTDYFFAAMRNACVVFVTLDRKPAATKIEELPAQQEPVKVEEIITTPVIEEVVPQAKNPFFMSMKTNMLYDLLAVPNIGVEFYLGRNWSVAGNWMYAWWKTDRHHRYWRTYGGDIAVRRWFGRKAGEKPLTGHHFGLYGQLVTYDFEWGGKGYLGDKWSYAGGVEYGYSLPVARRLNIDFTLGAGYLGGEYKTYNPMDGHYVWQSTKDRHWFGPTKAEVSLVWLIGRGNSNSKKGGAR
ncbi:DUF3575 domain-containing protein [Proteiniphilum sp.]|uniref:DUF3575 domain-containing protein n=1 Tax=Proteiniphilum sp. TaxID=1926877 RepID=UPI003317FB60